MSVKDQQMAARNAKPRVTSAQEMSGPIRLLWTSGSDSTYRLLDLVLNQARAVEPHYLIDRKRSTDIEIRRMGKIKEAIASHSREASGLICPTRFVDLGDLPDDGSRARQYEAICRERTLGRQYEYLARMADLLDVDGLEISVNGRARLDFLAPHLVRDVEGRYVLSQQVVAPEIKLFDRFVFPIFGLPKPEMMRIAEAAGWQHIMELTWFCLRPTRRREPCGICATCTQAVEEGMGFRLPARAWRRRRIASIVGPVKEASRATTAFVRDQGKALRQRPHRLVTRPLEYCWALARSR